MKNQLFHYDFFAEMPRHGHWADGPVCRTVDWVVAYDTYNTFSFNLGYFLEPSVKQSIR